MKDFVRIISIVICVITFHTHIKSQPHNLDSIIAIPYAEYVSDYNVYSPLFKDAYAYAYETNDSVSMATILLRQNVIEYLAGEIDFAVELAMQSIEISTALNNKKELSKALCLLGYQIKRQDLERAIDYMRQGIAIQENTADSVELLTSYDNYGVLKEFKGQLDSALYFSNLSLTLKKRLNDQNGIPFSWNKIANIHLLKGNHSLALQYMDSSSMLRVKDTNNYFYLGENEISYGDIYADWGKPTEAIRHFQQAIKYAELKDGYAYIIRDAAKRLTKLYEEKQDFQNAYGYSKMYQLYNDSIEGASTKRNMNNLLVRFESAEKEKTIAEQKVRLTEEALKSRNRQILLITSVLGFLLVIVFAIYRIHIARQNRLQAIKAGQLKLQNERIRVSRDLHDHIGAELTLIASATDQQARQIDNELIVSELKGISDNARYAMQQLRETIWAISPEPILMNAFAMRLHTYAQKMCQSSGIKLLTDNKVNTINATLSPAVTINLYRVCQEAINNVCKHAEAQTLHISYAFKGNAFSIVIKDDGKGFNEENIAAGYGLQNMRGRMQEIGGLISWNTVGRGTEVKLSVDIAFE